MEACCKISITDKPKSGHACQRSIVADVLKPCARLCKLNELLLQVLHMIMGLERLERITSFIDEASEAGIGDMAPSEPQESEDSFHDAPRPPVVMLSQRSGQMPQQISVEQQVRLVALHSTPAALALRMAGWQQLHRSKLELTEWAFSMYMRRIIDNTVVTVEVTRLGIRQRG